MRIRVNLLPIAAALAGGPLTATAGTTRDEAERGRFRFGTHIRDLAYLDSEEAILGLVDRLGVADLDSWISTVLISTKHRATVLARMEAGLHEPSRAISDDYLRTVATLRGGDFEREYALVANQLFEALPNKEPDARNVAARAVYKATGQIYMAPASVSHDTPEQ